MCHSRDVGASPLPRPATHGSILGVAGRGSGLVMQGL